MFFPTIPSIYYRPQILKIVQHGPDSMVLMFSLQLNPNLRSIKLHQVTVKLIIKIYHNKFLEVDVKLLPYIFEVAEWESEVEPSCWNQDYSKVKSNEFSKRKSKIGCFIFSKTIRSRSFQGEIKKICWIIG